MLRGPSGSGKTTLLNIIGGLDVPTSGRVWLRDVELTATRESDLVELRRRELGFVFQSFALLPMLTAAENVEVPLRLVGTPVAERTSPGRRSCSRASASRSTPLSDPMSSPAGSVSAWASRAPSPTGPRC